MLKHFRESLSCRFLLIALLLVFVPNIIFLLLAWYTHTARPVINVDYIAAILLLIAPFSWAQLAGVFILWIAIIFDALMMVVQLFPFMDLDGAINLLPFILSAPFIYQLFMLVLCIYILAVPFLLIYMGKKTRFYPVLVISAIIIMAMGLLYGKKYYSHDNDDSLFARNNFYYVHSQSGLYYTVQNVDFLVANNSIPVFSPLKYERASGHLNQPFSSKILFIVNESWGQPKDPALQQDILHGLLAQRDNFEVWQEGHFPFIGATVQGELRELCATNVYGYALKNSPATEFVNCLPIKLKGQGYATIALHGAEGDMYDRTSWYPKAGFARFIAREQLDGKPRCHSFDGVCDSALFDVVKTEFASHPKIFFYWMTLTTHIDYSEKDIFNHRLQCEKYGVDTNASLCRNFILQTQFFDGLAELVKSPEMKGVEVIVVGDHPPPAINLSEPYAYLYKGGEVSWIHFKVKE